MYQFKILTSDRLIELEKALNEGWKIDHEVITVVGGTAIYVLSKEDE